MVTKRYLRWILAVFAVAAVGSFILLTSEVQEARAGNQELIGTLDEICENFVNEHASKSAIWIASKITRLGSGHLLSAIALIVVVGLSKKRRWLDAVQVACVGAAAATATSVLKPYFQRPRPDTVLPLVDGASYSYPSGHSVAAAAMYFTFAFIFSKNLERNSLRRILFLATSILVFCIAISRVLLGVHFFSDICAGGLLGISLAAFSEFVKLHFESRQRLE